MESFLKNLLIKDETKKTLMDPIIVYLKENIKLFYIIILLLLIFIFLTNIIIIVVLFKYK